ncbi:hypothetical protein [Halomonas daqiaonensis]|uniref:Uncharacterized protein n=1 Tax=Halomonas daqiaonensis TaxID=650850 RepID=A0A1H7FXI5_9GAMM|nr:hypothetical protein [Halomonas daqiaonensis]SEK30783.1 hypothetical protein SAMN04488129_101232 [Halomonas daqiaonensis]
MFKKLFGKSPVEVWVIKQVDDGLLHLCGQGTLESQSSRKAILAALAQGQFQGGVRLAGGGLVLNTRLFAALVPLDDLTLTDDGQAHWHGRLWRVSQVPQRCWGFEGRLVAEQESNLHGPGLVSSEDVSGIRGRVAREKPHQGGVTFRADNELEDHPLTTKHRDERRVIRPTTRGERRDDERH